MKHIVWLASYPKSGNTWFRMFLANYLKNSAVPLSLDEIESTPIASNVFDFEEVTGLNPFELAIEEVDLLRPEVYRFLADSDRGENEYLFMKVHDAFTMNRDNEPLFPADASRCAIYFVRNPLDVCVSYAFHSASNVERMVDFINNESAIVALTSMRQLPQKLLSWKSHVLSWKEQTSIPILFARYEDMKGSPLRTFKEIVNFLGIESDDFRIKNALEHCDFKVLAQMEESNGFKEKPQKCQKFFRSGEAGNYKTNLSTEQIQRIINCNSDVMKHFNYLEEI